MKVLVTGGAGFIGSNLVEALLARGDQVVVLDNLITGREENLPAASRQLTMLRGDVRDLDVVNEAARGCEVVFHEAALPSVGRSLANPVLSHQMNTTGTLHTLVAARNQGVRRLVYASSSSIYGETPTLPKVEDMPANPISTYAITKLTGEQYCHAFTRFHGLDTVVLRYFNVFGPRQDPSSEYSAVIPRFITALLEGRSPVITGDGLQSRDFTYVANVVHANLLAADAPRERAVGQTFNVACGARYTLLDLLAALGRIIGASVAPTFADSRPGDVRHSQASIDKARAGLGYVPVVGFEEGLRRTVEWYRR